MHSFFFAIAAFVISSGVNAQDTLRSSHKFELPFGNAAAYEGAIAQQPAEIHDFVFTARDSGTVFIVLRSENDSLDIRLDREAIKKRKKEKKKTGFLFTAR